MKRLIGLTAALCLLAIMVGCGGTTGTGTLAYVSNSTGTGFTVFNVNTDGTLTRANISPQNTPTPTGTGPKVLQFSPNGKWAFYLDANGENIYAYTRAGNGTLATQIGVYPVNGASSLVVSSNSNFIYVALPSTLKLAVFNIDQSTGILTQVGSDMLVGYDIEQLVLSPGGSVLFGLSRETAAVLSFTLTASTGVATLTNTMPVDATVNNPVGATTQKSPNYLVLSANGSYAYVLGQFVFNPASPGTNIFGFTVGSGGALTAMPDSPFTENPDTTVTPNIYPTYPTGGVTTSDNRFLFVANNGTKNISAFKISTTSPGELSEVIGSNASPFACQCSPTFVRLAASNDALFVLDPGTVAAPAGKIYQFQIDQNTGKIRAQNPASVSTEGTPTWITIR